MYRKKDLLLIARPDHSYRLYLELLTSDLDFTYYSFKLFPKWLKKVIRNPRVRYYSHHYSSCVLTTIVHIARIKFRKGSWKRFEKPLMEFHLYFTLPKDGARLIHYWPNYCIDAIKKYKNKHPDVKTVAEIFFPNERWVIDHIKPLLLQHGLPMSAFEGIERDARNLDKIMAFENDFIVPSQFVADTYKEYYPKKNYIIVPYGITKWDYYKKKKEKKASRDINTFVYVGSVSIEKGCDLLLDFFCQHNDLILHLYGDIPLVQKHIFVKYMGLSNIFFHGSVPHTTIQQLISKYDVGIHLSQYDAYSLAVGEIIGAGLPVIVSQNTGISSDVLAYNLGVVSALDRESIEKSITTVLDVCNYNNLLINIDKFLNEMPQSYESCMKKTYYEIING